MRNRHLLFEQAGLLAAVAGTLFCSGASQAKETIYTETFRNIDGFSKPGRVYSGYYGVRIRSAGSITSGPIDISGYENVELEYSRSLAWLDQGESGTASWSVDGSSFIPIESERSASGTTRVQLTGSPPEATSLVLRFELDASSFFER